MLRKAGIGATATDTRHPTRTIVICLIVVIGRVSVTVAGPTEDAARDAAKKGTASYNLGRYEDAAVEYERAYSLVQDPALLFNLGQSWRLAGRAEKALAVYRSYLRTAPAEAPNREQAQRRAFELERLVASTKTANAVPPSTPQLLASESRSPVLVTAAVPSERETTPVYRKWWFWAGGAVVLGGVVAALIVARSSGSNSAPQTSLGTMSF